MSLGRPFWTWWWAAVLTNLGDGIRLAAFPLLAAQLTDAPVQVAAVAAAGAVPWLLAGLPAGVLADRVRARRLLPVADLSRVVVLAGLIALLLQGRAGIPAVVVAVLVLGVAETVRDTAAETVVPRLVRADQLERAGGRLTAGALVGNEFVGPLVGGALFGVGAVLPFVTSSAVTALAVLLLLSLPAPVLHLLGPAPRTAPAAGHGARAGLSFLRSSRLLRALVLVVAAVALADSAWFAVFVLYADQRLALGPAGFGALLALGSAGGLAGALLADRAVSGRRHRAAIGVSAAAATVTPALLLLDERLWAAGVVVVVTSAAFGVLNVAAAGLRHRLVPVELIGRVSAVWRTSAYVASGAGGLAGGALASAQGLAAPFALSLVLGVAATAAWCAATRRPVPA